MPADSTAAIGAETLAGMGRGLPGYSGRGQNARQMPVALSRGEFVLAPEQVHSIGAQALDAMRAGTHQWVAPGAQDSQRLFLANGGLVDEEERRRQQASFGDAAAAARDGSVRQISSAANHIPGYVAQRGAPDGAAVVPQPPPERPKTFTEDVLDTAARDAQAGWRQGGAAGLGQTAGALARGAATAVPAAFVDAADDVVNGPPGRLVGGLWRGLTGGGNEAQASQAQERQPAASQPAASQPAPPTERAPQAAGLPSYAPPGNPPQTPSASAGLPSYRQFGGQPGGEMADGQIHYDPATRTYSGRDIGADAAFASSRNGGGSLSVMPTGEGLERTQRMAAIYRDMAGGPNGFAAGAPAFNAPRHSGNDWQARNELRNAQVSAGKLAGTWDRYLNKTHGGDVAMEGYRKALEADAIARGQQAPLQQEAMSQQGALAQAALREQGEMARARMNGALAQGRLDLAQRQQQQAERMGAIERGMAGLGFSRALRLEQAQNDLLNARSPQEQEQARQRLNLLAGNAAARENPKDNYTTLTGPNGEQTLVDLRTQRVVSPRYESIDQDPRAQAIRGDASLSREQKEARLRALGYA
ncbi:MAG: hypothetical protein ACTTJV_08660 [Ottowia sp.]